MATSDRTLLDISTIETIEHFNATDWREFIDHDYADPNWEWLRFIKYPASCADMDRLHDLSQSQGSKFDFYWSMGDVYYRPKKENEIVPD